MRKLRDVFYISANFEENYFLVYGLEFKELTTFCPIELKNLLITDGRFVGNRYNTTLNLETVNGQEEIEELCKEDLYGLGNFHWVDYCDEEALDKCTPEEKAEIVYLSHFGTPLKKSAFFQKIKNQFFYLSHDDGWVCKLYCKDMPIFTDLIAHKIINHCSTNKRRKIVPMDEQIKNQFLELTKEGLLIDFSSIYRDSKTIGLRFYTIGHFTDMDEMYNNLERNIYRAKMSAILEHRNKTWKVIS
ncbi:MAG TPA: hypothetical protein DDY49_06945 [Paenibacillaceae bacterium]|nr:hypothetical protein [Paenibacillaceae bacterium]